jgi:hypothetical protein
MTLPKIVRAKATSITDLLDRIVWRLLVIKSSMYLRDAMNNTRSALPCAIAHLQHIEVQKLRHFPVLPVFLHSCCNTWIRHGYAIKCSCYREAHAAKQAVQKKCVPNGRVRPGCSNCQLVYSHSRALSSSVPRVNAATTVLFSQSRPVTTTCTEAN